MIATRIVTAEADLGSSIIASLERRPDVEVVLRCSGRVEILAAVRGAGPKAVVTVGRPEWLDDTVLVEIAERQIGLVGLTDDPAERVGLEGGGAIVLPSLATGESIVAACRRGLDRDASRPAATAGTGTGRLIAVWGPKGAPGRTSIALELAWILGADEPRTVLIDADPYGGDALQLLGITEDPATVLWAARMAEKGELADRSMGSELARAEGGPLVLGGLLRPEQWADVSTEGFTGLLGVMRQQMRIIVCDVGFCLEGEPGALGGRVDGRNRMALTALRAADAVVAVGRADPVGLKNFLWAHRELERWVDPAKIVVAANRVLTTQRDQVQRLIAEHTGGARTTMLPDCPDDFERAVQAGSTVTQIAPRSEMSLALSELAGRLGAKTRARGFMARLGERLSP